MLRLKSDLLPAGMSTGHIDVDGILIIHQSPYAGHGAYNNRSFTFNALFLITSGRGQGSGRKLTSATEKSPTPIKGITTQLSVVLESRI